MTTHHQYLLPEFRRGELAQIKAREFSAVVILDVGGRLAFGTTGDPRRFSRHFASTQEPCRVAAVLWSAGPPLSRRIVRLTEEALTARRVADSGRFDIPLGLAIGAAELAASKIGARLHSTAQVLAGLHQDAEGRIEAQVAAMRRCA